MPIRLLLDEDVPVPLRHDFDSAFDVETVEYVVLCGNDVRLPALRELMPEANEMIRSVERGTLARVFPPNEATP